MSKITAVHVCSKCDAQFPKWSGRCESCGSWGTISKTSNVIGQTSNDDPDVTVAPAKVKDLAQLFQAGVSLSVPSGNLALDSVLGGGLTKGAAILLAGEPGMGKSTLLSQAALDMAAKGKKILYVCGEESPSQVALRLKRLGAVADKIDFIDDTRVETICATIHAQKPDLTIIDSVQSVSTEAATGESGGISQVRACAAQLTQCAKKTDVPIILVGQVTKDGDIAGPRALEHVVDVVLSLEGDRLHRFRILRAIKNRFGSTDETVLMDMDEKGLQVVQDPSMALLTDRPQAAPGSAIGCVLEGRRPMLVELQALVSPAGYSAPVRRGNGLDNTRLGMLLAVLTRHAGIAVYDKDVYANATGGIDVRDPGADLALAAAIASAVNKKTLDPKTAYFGEIGLTGELRPVALPELRIREIARMGFETVVCPILKNADAIKNIKLVQCKNIREALV